MLMSGCVCVFEMKSMTQKFFIGIATNMFFCKRDKTQVPHDLKVSDSIKTIHHSVAVSASVDSEYPSPTDRDHKK
jgi:hypothetical protein